MTREEQRQVGARIAEARRLAGLTQGELAERLGVTTRSIQNYEAGATVPYRHLGQIESLVPKRPGWVLSGGDTPELLARITAHQQAMREHYALLQEHLATMRRQFDLLREQREASERRRSGSS